MKKRFIWSAVGLGYAVVYGFWTMMTTGGGHGNFIWFVLFLLGYIFGLIFPAMGLVLADLRPRWAKVAGLLISIVAAGLTLRQLLLLGEKGTQDVVDTWNRSPMSFVIMSVIHFLPLVAFTALVVRSMIRKSETPDLGRLP